MKIILLGAPGSGKGTQAKEISNRYKVPHISTGDIFRENIKNQTPLGKKVSAIIAEGRLCPDDITCELVKDRLSKDDCKNGYLLDGFPRNLFQAESLDGFAAPDKVINLVVNLAKIERRITGRRNCAKCGESYHIDFIGDVKDCPACGGTLTIREDDNPQTVKERLSVYEEQTEPLIGFYKAQGKLVDINGDQTIEKVFDDIVKVLD